MSETRFETPTDVEIVITRDFEAPRELIWEVWTRCEHMANWMLGPEGWTMPVCEIDLRPGGTFRTVWRNDDGTEMEIKGTYREVEPPERLVHTESWGEDLPESVDTLVLTEEAGRTTVTLTMRYPSKDARDAALETGMKEGMAASYERLEAYLPKVS